MVEMPAVEEGQAGEAALAGDEQGGAERRLVDTPAQHEVGTHALVLAGRDRLEADEQVVQARAAGQADLEGGPQDALVGAQQRLGVLDGQEAQEALGADAGPAAEHALGMERADAHGVGHLLERGLLQPVVGDEADRALDPVIVAVRRGGGMLHGLSPKACCTFN